MVGFSDRLALAVQQTGVGACIGLDPHLDRLPPSLDVDADPVAAAKAFCMGVIDVVAGVVPSVKPQVAFFEALGAPGVQALQEVVHHAQRSGLVVVLDAKRGDIGSTAKAYARATVDPAGPMGADSVTLSPYLGEESLLPFIPYCRQDRGLFALVRTSNPGAGIWQNTGSPSFAESVASWLSKQNEATLGDCGLGPFGAVIGATLLDEAPKWRDHLQNAWLLVPGYGAQGATGKDIRPHFRKDGYGCLVVSARGVLFPSKGRADTQWKTGVSERVHAMVADLKAHTPVI